jgi:hypothetical protein
MIDVKKILKRIEGNYMCSDIISVNPQTGLVNCNGSVAMYNEYYSNSLLVNWGIVSRDFECSNNQLKSLNGAPQEVGGNFDCSDNRLTSLKGFPQIVNGYVDISMNRLTSLNGLPQNIKRQLICSSNRLTSLEGGPIKVGDDFFCDDNKLTTLKGAPQIVGGSFCCDNNNLISLEGLPQMINENIQLDYSPKLPLLKLLLVKGLKRIICKMNIEIEFIMNKYLGKGYSGMVPCARELIKAGFNENARL